jgi:hypothetical protein
MSQNEAERLVPLNGKAKKYATKPKKTTQPKKCPEKCGSETQFLSVSMLARHLMRGVHKMGTSKATGIAEAAFGKSMGKTRNRKARERKEIIDEDE